MEFGAGWRALSTVSALDLHETLINLAPFRYYIIITDNNIIHCYNLRD